MKPTTTTTFLAALLMAGLATQSATALDTGSASVYPDSCSKDANGWSVSEAECNFTCTRNHDVSVTVTSEDGQDKVEGKAFCRDTTSGSWGDEKVTASCNGGWYCHDDGVATVTGNARCYGKATATFNSGPVYVACRSTSPGPNSGRGAEVAGLGELQDAILEGSTAAAPEEPGAAGTMVSEVTLTLAGGQATATACSNGWCMPVVPLCVLADGWLSCEA